MKGTHILMHKNKEVATCVFDSRGYLKSISKIHNEKLLPVCVGEDNPSLDLQRWILARNLATNRRDIAPLREFYGSSPFLSELGISLFDCYWFANNEHRDWEKENPYDNWSHKNDGIFLMFNHPDELHEINTNSPNLTIPGRNQRIWYRDKSGLCLLHGNAQREMTNYKLAEGRKVVAERNYVVISEIIYASVRAETSKEVERVSLEDMYNVCKDPQKTKMQNLQTTCEKFNIPNWKDFFASMCEYDDIIQNTSRELCDIGVLRNTETLETIGFEKL